MTKNDFRRWVRPLLSFLLCLLFSSSVLSFSKGGRFDGKRFSGFPDSAHGWGLIVGEPVLLRYIQFKTWKQAWYLSGGYSLYKNVALATADYVFYGYHANDKVINEDFWNSLIFYGGPGILAGAGMAGSDPGDAIQVAIRAVGGVEYIFNNTAWSGRLEFVPEFFIKGQNNFGFAIGLGATYYFFDGASAERRTIKRPTAPPQPSGLPPDF